MSETLLKPSQTSELDNLKPKMLSDAQMLDKRIQFMDITDYDSLDYTKCTVYDLLSEIRDPEHNANLEELDILTPDDITLTSKSQSLMKKI